MADDASALRKIAQNLARRDRETLADLIERRRRAGLTQSAIDSAFGLPEGSTRKLEAYYSDPKLSELRRYEGFILFMEQHSGSGFDFEEHVKLAVNSTGDGDSK